LVETRQPIVANSRTEYAALGIKTVPGTDIGHSTVMVPILGGDRVLGSIFLEDFDRENAYGEAEVRLLSTVAASMGVALENARLFDETQRLLKETEQRAAELAIINSVQEGLAAQLNFQAIIDLVGNKIAEIFGTRNMYMALLDRVTNLITMPYWLEHGERFPVESFPLGIGLTGEVIRTRTPLVISENVQARAAQLGATSVGDPATENSARSYLGVPILKGDEAVGAIGIYSKNENAFGESNVRLLQTLANAMTVALENARLFDETQRLLKETEQRAAELAIINSVQQALAAELNMQGIYDAVGDKIREIFNQADVGIRIYDPQSNLIHYPYLYEGGQRIAIKTRQLSDKGFARHVISTRETVVVNEDMKGAAAKYGSSTMPGTQEEKSAVYVPLVGGDQARGLISLVDLEREHAFSASDVRLLQTLANSMSVALENARLFDETQRLFKESEQRATELAVINRIQEGMAAELDFQAIVDLVGDKLREVFRTGDIGIRWYDPKANLNHFLYQYERGVRLSPPPRAPSAGALKLMQTRQPVVVNNPAEYAALGFGTTPTDQSHRSRSPSSAATAR
jgi:GAF domain-containing protein